MPFLAIPMSYNGTRSTFDGILGLSPYDDSSGPLLVKYLYD